MLIFIPQKKKKINEAVKQNRQAIGMEQSHSEACAKLIQTPQLTD